MVTGRLRFSNRMGRGMNPSTCKPLWDIPFASDVDLVEAVTAASAAFQAWSTTSWTDRQARLRQVRAVPQSHRSEMARLLSIEGGRPPQFGELEVQHALDFLDFYCTSLPYSSYCLPISKTWPYVACLIEPLCPYHSPSLYRTMSIFASP